MKFSTSVATILLAVAFVNAQYGDVPAAATTTAATAASSTGTTTTALNANIYKNDHFVAAVGVDGTDAVFAVWYPNSTITGWIGIGIGKGMSDADIYLSWFTNTSTTPKVTDRTATNHSLPLIDTVQTVTVLDTVPTVLSSLVPTKLSVAAKSLIIFKRPLAATGADKAISVTDVNNFIWAVNTVPVVNATIKKHEYKGTFTLSLSQSTTATGSSTTGTSKTGGADKSRASLLIVFVAMIASLMF
ncbi:hypothetical protein HK096_004683 [Nowakowskiella sp. JEL0078]|nr:hypothetical protein HK096_004683 [Nowakowskiella sp. JEL0078]